MNEKELYREIKSGAFSMQVADCERNIKTQFEKLQQENLKLKKQLEEYKLITIDYQELEARNQKLEAINQKLKEVFEKAVEYIKIYRSYQKIDNKDYLKGRDEIGCLDIYQIDELLDILKGVE